MAAAGVAAAAGAAVEAAPTVAAPAPSGAAESQRPRWPTAAAAAGAAAAAATAARAAASDPGSAAAAAGTRTDPRGRSRSGSSRNRTCRAQTFLRRPLRMSARTSSAARCAACTTAGAPYCHRRDSPARPAARTEAAAAVAAAAAYHLGCSSAYHSRACQSRTRPVSRESSYDNTRQCRTPTRMRPSASGTAASSRPEALCAHARLCASQQQQAGSPQSTGSTASRDLRGAHTTAALALPLPFSPRALARRTRGHAHARARAARRPEAAGADSPGCIDWLQRHHDGPVQTAHRVSQDACTGLSPTDHATQTQHTLHSLGNTQHKLLRVHVHVVVVDASLSG